MKIWIILAVILVAMQSMGWWAYKASQENGTDAPAEKVATVEWEQEESPVFRTTIEGDPIESSEIVDLDLPENQERYKNILVDGGITYPLIQLEEVDGMVERTIHMGVRQWAWDPFTLEAGQGEKIRLVIHNADVLHSIEIPELGVSAAIPEEGAVVEFIADRTGTFEFSCGATHCGKDHDKMKGFITIF